MESHLQKALEVLDETENQSDPLVAIGYILLDLAETQRNILVTAVRNSSSLTTQGDAFQSLVSAFPNVLSAFAKNAFSNPPAPFASPSPDFGGEDYDTGEDPPILLDR